jgi:hypothetical protein
MTFPATNVVSARAAVRVPDVLRKDVLRKDVLRKDGLRKEEKLGSFIGSRL